MDYRYENVRAYKAQAIKAAKDFGYDDRVIADLKAVKSVTAIDCVMKNARKERFKQMDGDTNKKEGIGPKTDCFAYRKSSIDPGLVDCRALTQLYCAKEKCRFYKRKGEK